jgi:hypothetical protein
VEDDIQLMSYKMYNEFNLLIHLNYGQDVKIAGYILSYPFSPSRLLALSHYIVCGRCLDQIYPYRVFCNFPVLPGKCWHNTSIRLLPPFQTLPTSPIIMSQRPYSLRYCQYHKYKMQCICIYFQEVPLFLLKTVHTTYFIILLFRSLGLFT